MSDSGSTKVSPMNRRQLGKRLLAGTILAASNQSNSLLGLSSRASSDASVWKTVFPGVLKATIGVPETISPVSSRLVSANRDALAKQGEHPVILPAPIGGANQHGTVLSLPLAPHELIYGFGLQFFSLENRGKKRVLRVNADPRGDTGESHAPVPFYVSSLGYGILIDTARYASFYCGNGRPKPTKSMDDGPSSTDPLYTKNLDIDEASRVTIDIPVAKGVDVYYFAGPTMLDAVRRYNLFAGGGVNPPEWGLGFWYRVSSNSTAGDTLALAKEFRSRQIPCDVIGLESGWQTHAYSCSFVWNQARFPEPAEFIREMTGRDFKVNLWEHAFTHPSSPVFPALRDLAGDRGVWGGLVPDFQNAAARQAFGKHHGERLIDPGISGFKLDECDNSDYTGGWSFPEFSQFPSGVDGEQMHSLFGVRYQDTLWREFQKRQRETYSLVRSSGALASPYPFVLYSDLYDHRQFVRALVTASFSGLLWCPEVRDAKSEEDLIRRLQTVVFSPLTMINGWYIANPPWKQLDRKKNNANELRPDWQDLEARCREIIGWRMQIIPYLQAAFALYATDGTPPFRALALDWPDVPELAKIDDAWMVGDRMLVAPLFAGEAKRTLTLPSGLWHDFWTGKDVAGGSVLEFMADTPNIPVFVKGGSVLPLAQITNSTADPARRNLEVQVFGDGKLPFELKTARLDLRLTWDGKSGDVRQKGKETYSVSGWKRRT